MLESSVDSDLARQSPACTSAVPGYTCALPLLLAPLTLLSAPRDPYPRLLHFFSLFFFIFFFLPRGGTTAAGICFVFYFSARSASLDSCDSVLVVGPLASCLLLYLSYSANKLTFRMNECVPTLSCHSHPSRGKKILCHVLIDFNKLSFINE